ncbi:hypothetical protein BCR42DRAFT_453257 [Absidia repens]|uniref:Mitochondrial distribution and morphology protein 12 n=1 Tax=Absidia repens TaxID=90262 RepID=A0A1X2IBP4_9FUNG|nr:hypothetical protein BCR42DRAFT_453257 [Absidia repens]
MSFDIDWSKLDDELAGYVQQFLNRHFQAINKPAFIGDIHVTSFDWGTTPPTIEIVDITDPFPEFYEPEETEDDLDTDSPSKTVNSTSDNKNSTNPSVTHQHLSSSPTNTGDPLLDSLENSNKHQYSEPPSSLSGAHQQQQQQQQQQQRIQLLHSFHRSPLVAPQHPFNNTRPMPSRSGSYFSPSPTSPTNSSYFDQRFASPFIDNRQAWIDDQNRLLNPEATTSSPLSNPSSPLPPPPASQTTSVPHSVPLQDISATQMDFQAHLLVSYKGDMSMTVLTELRMNYPSMIFMSLPIQLRVRSVEFEATALVAYIQSMNRVCVSMLEADDEEVVSLRGKSAVGLESLLRQVQIESVVGDEQKHVLKNVGKIERFIVDQLRKMLDDELVFPSYQCVELGP